MYRVLLVLDSDDLSAVLHKKLSTDFEVEICDAATAAEIIDHYQPDALILDLFLSGTDGFQMLLNATYSVPSIILLTLLVSSDILELAAKLNVNYIFLKPFKISVLVKLLYEFLNANIK